MSISISGEVRMTGGNGSLGHVEVETSDEAYDLLDKLDDGLRGLRRRDWPGAAEARGKGKGPPVVVTLKAVGGEEDFPEPKVTIEWRPGGGKVGSVALAAALKQVAESAGLS